MSNGVPESIARVRPYVDEAMRAAVKQLDPYLGLIASYQLGWCDRDGNPTKAGGKSIRPTLVVLSAEAVGGTMADALPAAAAVELVHNFSLLHDDVMDDDVERRHRPTGWAVFGKSQAILGGSAMFALALELLTGDEPGTRRSLRCLLEASQQLIAGQSADILFEQAAEPQLADCVEMEAGKTAALLSCSSSIGAMAAGGSAHSADRLARFGYELGLAFQFVDDVLGIVGDPAVTGKSSSSDIRQGKRSAPVVAALNSGGPQARELADRMAQGLPQTEADVEAITRLVLACGGVDWANAEAERRLAAALSHLDEAELVAGPGESGPGQQFASIARYVVTRTS